MADDRLPAYLAIEYRSDGTITAVAPSTGEQEPNALVRVRSACRRIGVVLAKAGRNLVNKTRFNMPLRVQFGDECSDRLSRPDSKPRKGLRVRLIVFGHVIELHAACDDQHGTAGGVACKRGVAPTPLTTPADEAETA